MRMTDSPPILRADASAVCGRIDDLDLHGIVGIRLIDASPLHLAELRSELAPIEPSLPDSPREPDVVIRFVDRIQTSAPVCAVGLDGAEFAGDAYLVGVPGSRGRASIPLDRVGDRCEILCEKTLPRVPLLRPIVHLTALARGVAPTHASAVELCGRGIVTTGWTSGGKTGILLTLMALGGRFISDDLLYIAADGQIYGLHEPLSIKDYYLDEAPQFRDRLTAREKQRIRSVRLLESTLRSLPDGLAHRLSSDRTRRRLAKLAVNGRTVHVRPERLFGAEHCVKKGQLSTALLAQSTDASRVELAPLPARELALRMAVSSRHEFETLDAHYQMFRFAFPALRNPHLEQAEARILETLLPALEGAQAYRLSHPYPASIRALTLALEPLADAQTTSPRRNP
jgi:hypothetical protein